jgi:hypothetical protein
MAKRKAQTEGGQAGSTGDAMEKRLLAFAEQVGRIAGTVQAKTEEWLDRDALNAQLSGIRESATELLQQMGATRANAAGKSGGETTSTNRSSSSAGRAKPAPAKNASSGRQAGGKQPAAAKRNAPAGKAAGKSAKKSAMKSAARGRSGGAVDAPGKKHRGPMPSEGGATGNPRGDGARLAKLRAANLNRMQRRG